MPYLLTFLMYTFSIVQQPADLPYYVNQTPNIFTDYSLVPDGNIGLLAELNKPMLELSAGDILTLTYWSGKQEQYEIVAIITYHTSTPCSITGTFVSDKTGREYSSSKVAHLVYADAPQRLILTTCFDLQLNQPCAPGRFVVVAYPIDKIQRDSYHPALCGGNSKSVRCQ